MHQILKMQPNQQGSQFASSPPRNVSKTMIMPECGENRNTTTQNLALAK